MKNVSSKQFLDLKIYPNKSLTLLTLMILFFIFFFITSIISIYFIFIGAWPVSFFLILDFILLFYAFKSYRKATRIYDRIILKAVPDFIDVHYANYHWFTFNVADIFITIGIICFILKEIFVKSN